MGVHFLHAAAGEVTAAQRLDSLLQGAVQRRLSAGVRVQEQEAGHGLDEHLLPQADVARQLGADDSCRGRGRRHVREVFDVTTPITGVFYPTCDHATVTGVFYPTCDSAHITGCDPRLFNGDLGH